MRQVAIPARVRVGPSGTLQLWAGRLRDAAELAATPRRSMDHRCLRDFSELKSLVASAALDVSRVNVLEAMIVTLRPDRLLDLVPGAGVLRSSTKMSAITTVVARALPPDGTDEFDTIILSEVDSSSMAYEQIGRALSLLRWDGVVLLTACLMQRAPWNWQDSGSAQYRALARVRRENPRIVMLPLPAAPSGLVALAKTSV